MSARDQAEDVTHHRSVADKVTKETVNPHHEEHVTRKIDKDIHQDHHRTVEQPLMDKQVLPEQHHERVADTEERTFGSKRDGKVEEDLTSARQYKDEHTRTGTTDHGVTGQDQVTGRVHHHVHEHVQPVVYKETIEPHVTHTTKPIHETHHLPPTHERDQLPPMSMDEFKSSTGGTTSTTGTHGHQHNTRGAVGSTGGSTTAAGAAANAMQESHTKRHGGTDPDAPNAPFDDDKSKSSSSGQAAGSQGPHSSSLLNKLDPRVDSTGDGKKGFMS